MSEWTDATDQEIQQVLNDSIDKELADEVMWRIYHYKSVARIRAEAIAELKEELNGAHN